MRYCIFSCVSLAYIDSIILSSLYRERKLQWCFLSALAMLHFNCLHRKSLFDSVKFGEGWGGGGEGGVCVQELYCVYFGVLFPHCAIPSLAVINIEVGKR